jgi:hypothetical protein
VGIVTEVKKWGQAVQMSDETRAEADATRAVVNRYMNATPEEHAAWARQAAEQRAAERAHAEPVEPTMDALLAKLGWGPQYARHVVQPYCRCEDDIDGWSRCLHATDLGLEVWQ